MVQLWKSIISGEAENKASAFHSPIAQLSPCVGLSGHSSLSQCSCSPTLILWLSLIGSLSHAQVESSIGSNNQTCV